MGLREPCPLRCILWTDYLFHSGSLLTALRQYKNVLGIPLVSSPRIATRKSVK